MPVVGIGCMNRARVRGYHIISNHICLSQACCSRWLLSSANEPVRCVGFNTYSGITNSHWFFFFPVCLSILCFWWYWAWIKWSPEPFKGTLIPLINCAPCRTRMDKPVCVSTSSQLFWVCREGEQTLTVYKRNVRTYLVSLRSFTSL